MYLSEMLQQHRSQHKLTQKQVAAKLGMSREYYSKIETGRTLPPILLLDKISKLLNTRIYMLFPFDDPFNRSVLEDTATKDAMKKNSFTFITHYQNKHKPPTKRKAIVG